MNKKCGAKTRDGTPCENAPMPNGRCRMHGGATPVALALPQTKSGRYSKYLPQRLLGRYFESLDDQQILHLREEVALLDARLVDLLARVEGGESGKAWGRLAEAWTELSTARVVGDRKRMQEAWAELGLVIEAGNTDYAAWQEIQSVIEQRRRLSESERKREIEQQQSVRLDQAMLVVSALITSVKSHADPTAFAAISNDFARILGRADEREEAAIV